jgi:DNA-binding transcriptional ArsR family regulator
MHVAAARTHDTARPFATLDLALLREAPPRVAISQASSLAALASDVAGANRGSPREWVAAARAELEPGDLAVMRPIGNRSTQFTPGRLNNSGIDGANSIDEELERVATLPVETLLDDIAFAYGPDPPPPWDAVVRRPRRWLERYAAALGRVGRGMREHWAAAAPLFEREIERVETAASRDALPELMSRLHHRAHVRDGVWRLEDSDRLALRPPDGGLVITPVLGGPEAGRARYNEEGLLRSITYALPGADRVFNGDLLPPAQALESLLGPQRARIVQMLDRPRNAGELAKALFTSPGAATHHLRALETAGLIVRERDGSRVIVHRTARGSVLLNLYQGRAS